ncbi:phage tail assembly chaperone [Tsuneonella sp. HG249]
MSARQSHPRPLPQAGGESCFGASALALCGLAARALGWRPGEFWPATPAELAACLADPSAPPAPLGRADLTRLMESDPDGHG